jgi:hypothetical protein
MSSCGQAELRRLRSSYRGCWVETGCRPPTARRHSRRSLLWGLIVALAVLAATWQLARARNASPPLTWSS